MALSKDEFLKWLLPIVQEMIEQNCKSIIEEECKKLVNEECQKVVENYVQQKITKIVFEKMAQNVFGANPMPPQVEQPYIPMIPNNIPNYNIPQPVQEVKSKKEVYDTFEKFIPGAKALVENVQAPQSQNIPDKKKFIPTPEVKNMFSNIVDSVSPQDVALHRSDK